MFNMFVSYLIKLYLLSIVCKCADAVSSHSLLPSHCNYTIDTIDAITNFTNGSLFVASGQNYWSLRPHEKPIHSNALRISDLLGEDVLEVEAAVNLKIRADQRNRRCVSVDERLLFYSKTPNDTTVINIYEDHKWSVYRDVSEVDVLSAAKTVNWSMPIDAIGNFEDITVIFQGDSYISIQCEGGIWQEVRHLSIPVSFSDIRGPIDSANFIKTHSLIDDAFLYMFKDKEFFICPVYGSDPCSGPLSIVDEFFGFDEECGLNPKSSKAEVWIYIILGIIVIVLVVLLFGFCCFALIARSRKITWWVNRRRSKDRTQGMTYETLNGQTDGTVKSTEMKTTNGEKLETNLDEPINTPFIDSNGKDEH